MGEHAGQTDEDNRAGVQGSRPNRKTQNGSAKVILLGGGGCLHVRGKKREIFGIERCQTQATGAGQEALSESAPNWRGTALQYPTNAKKVKHRGQKKMVWRGVGAGDSKQKGLSILFLGQSAHRLKAHILSFPSRSRTPPNFYPITVFSSLGAKKNSGTAAVLWYCICSTSPG